MKQINVVDLDHTLIKYDTFKYYYFYFCTRDIVFSVKTLYRLILRVLHVLDSATFFRLGIQEARRRFPNYPEVMKYFAERALKNIDPIVLNLIKDHSDTECVTLICTASPEDYVKYIAEKLSFPYICSYFDKEDKFHFVIGGKKKLQAIESQYSKEKFSYNFAISDSWRDRPLLKDFDSKVHYQKFLFRW